MAQHADTIISHWNKSFEDFQESPQTFYELLEKALETRKIPSTKLSRINYQEGGILSGKREYFRIKRKEHIFDICAAPFGNGFFVSWWLGQNIGFFAKLLLMIPFVGPSLLSYFAPQTYFKIDTASMFQGQVHAAVLEVIDSITQAKGLRALLPEERKPIFSNLIKSQLA